MSEAVHLVARGLAYLNEGLDCHEKSTKEPVQVGALDYVEGSSVTDPYIWVEVTFMDIELPSGDGSPPCNVVKCGVLTEANNLGFSVETEAGEDLHFSFFDLDIE